MLMRLKYAVGCEKIQLSNLLGKKRKYLPSNPICFIIWYIIWFYMNKQIALFVLTDCASYLEILVLALITKTKTTIDLLNSISACQGEPNALVSNNEMEITSKQPSRNCILLFAVKRPSLLIKPLKQTQTNEDETNQWTEAVFGSSIKTTLVLLRSSFHEP